MTTPPDGSNALRRRGRPRTSSAPDAVIPSGVDSVERALTILEAFNGGVPSLSLADLAGRTGLYPSTILRIATSLDRFGYLHRGKGGQFRLGPAVLRLGLHYRNAFDLADYVRPALDRVVERTGETSTFFVREGDRRVCLYRRESPRTLRYHIDEGAILPLDRGAGGHVLLAFTGGASPALEEVRTRRIAASVGERDPEIAAIAAPVFGRDDGFLGALGISGPRARFEGVALDALIATLAAEAKALSRALGC
ncbi:IclR family transcriptional regulator [Roseomonas sp. HJA6]|uniref:IclR family transcriptional regulator n=1 Tax=Roseomonas alba TaxID=2846776 RepID=A0ABS7AG53_9PROT|nr:IclR family transcriptional regulator [Neoroseomonas alba]MBW6401279.1 IclR family transcriptional regulator [Neoroseomonas alba]